MNLKLENLIEQAHNWFRFMSQYNKDQDIFNNELIKEGVRGKGFDKEFMAKVVSRDNNVKNMPYKVAEELIKDNYNQEEIQYLIDSIDKFKKYDPDTFSNFGSFLSVMMEKLLYSIPELTIKTNNNSTVHVPKFYMSFEREVETPYPWEWLEDLKEYNKDNLLISHLATNLSKGKILIEGNVGNFFAAYNRGSIIQLNGECGWRPCFNHLSGETVINGISGYELADSANGGRIYINGNIRSIGSYYAPAYDHQIFHNWKLLPKKGAKDPKESFLLN